MAHICINQLAFLHPDDLIEVVRTKVARIKLAEAAAVPQGYLRAPPPLGMNENVSLSLPLKALAQYVAAVAQQDFNARPAFYFRR